MASCGPVAKRGRVEEDLDDSFGNATTPVLTRRVTTQANGCLQNRNQDAAEFSQSGLVTMWKWQKENAERNLEKLRKDTANKTLEMTQRIRQLETQKDREIRLLKEQLSSAQRENMFNSFRANTTSNGAHDVTADRSILASSSQQAPPTSNQAPPTAVLRTKAVEIPARSSFPSAASRFAWMNKGKHENGRNHSVFKHSTNQNGNETFAQLSSQVANQNIFPSQPAPSCIPHTLSPPVESTSIECQTELAKNGWKLESSEQEKVLGGMSSCATVRSSQHPFDMEAIEGLSRLTNEVIARDILRPISDDDD